MGEHNSMAFIFCNAFKDQDPSLQIMYVRSSPLAKKLIALADCNSNFMSKIDLGSINRLDETGSLFVTQQRN